MSIAAKLVQFRQNLAQQISTTGPHGRSKNGTLNYHDATAPLRPTRRREISTIEILFVKCHPACQASLVYQRRLDYSERDFRKEGRSSCDSHGKSPFQSPKLATHLVGRPDSVGPSLTRRVVTIPNQSAISPESSLLQFCEGNFPEAR